MKFITFIFCLALLSCTNNIWITKTAVRPKKAKFSILNSRFTASEKLNYNNMYRASTYYEYDFGKYMSLYNFIGFYPDGRFIGASVFDTNYQDISKFNSWESANIIGYYRIENDSLRIQVYLPHDGGQFVTQYGIIEDSMIRFYEKKRGKYNKTIFVDTSFASDVPMR